MNEAFMNANYGCIFDKVDETNRKQIERTLMSLTAVSFEPEMAVDVYYNIGKCTLVLFILCLDSVNRMLALSNQLENSLCLYAMDALRNLVIQAFLIDKINFA